MHSIKMFYSQEIMDVNTGCSKAYDHFQHLVRMIEETPAQQGKRVGIEGQAIKDLERRLYLEKIG